MRFATRCVVETLEQRCLLSATYNFQTVATFSGPPSGEWPQELVRDANGNLLGVTFAGGTSGYGTVFEIPKGSSTITTLCSFSGSDGSPIGGLALDSSDDLFGTTRYGGSSSDGAVFEYVRGANAVITIASFDGSNGKFPGSGITRDANGNLFGTTPGNAYENVSGTVFEIANGSSAITTIATFNGAGNYPITGITLDSSGDMFGATLDGGTANMGTVFEIPHGTATISVLASFIGQQGVGTLGQLALDQSGNLFGATLNGGPTGSGTVYEVARGSGAVTTLVNFSGSQPSSGLTLDSSGNLFGTTYAATSYALGTVFEIPHGTNVLTTLHGFTGPDGSNPVGGVVLDSIGDIFGTATGGPNYSAQQLGFGSIFELTPIPQLTFAGAIANQSAGHAFSPAVVVDVEGPNGQVLTTDYSAITLSAIGSGVLQGFTTVNAVNGVAMFSDLVINIAGKYQLYASDASDNPTVSAAFTVNPGAPSQLVFASQPSNAKAGADLNPPVVIYEMDPYGNIVRNDTSTVNLSVESGPGGISGIAGVALNNGPAVFSNVFFDTPGTYTLIARDGSLNAPISSSFQIATQYQLIFAAGPTNTPAGMKLSTPVVVYLMDYLGNIIRNNNSTVTLSVASGPGAISGTTSVALSNGAAVFANLSFPTAGDYTITAKDGTFASVTSSLFVVSTATKLIFAAPPTNTTAGRVYNPPVVVYVEDQFGNIIRNVNTAVTLAVHSGPTGSKVYGTVTVNLSNGAAVFSNVWLQTAGSYTLTSTDGSLTAPISGTFTIAPAAANKLAFTSLPTSPKHATAFTVKVSVEDVYGNVLTSQSTGTITLALVTHPSGSTLGGTLTANIVKGVATFSNLTVNLAGSYSFKASDSFSIAAATSTAIVVS